MVVNMMKWSPWPPAPATTKFQVKVNQMKLEGFSDGTEELAAEHGKKREKVIGIRLSWRGERKSGIVPFYRNSRRRRDFSGETTVVESGGIVEWDDEFENLCCFTMGSSGGEFCPWDVTFNLLFGESKGKMNVIGKVSLNIGEMASKMESQLQTKLPITSQVAGVARDAILLVSLGFVEIRDSKDSHELVHNSIGANSLMGHSLRLEGKPKEKNKQLSQEEVSLSDSDRSITVESEGTSESGSALSPSSETQLDRVKKVGLFSWKRRRLSFKPAKEKSEPLIEKTSEKSDRDRVDVDPELTGSSSVVSINSGLEKKPIVTTTDNWETKELISRDGQTKLKTNLFFASFDQRSDKAAGESACTALVAVIAHWLHTNRAATPTKPEFDRLIIDGSLEWRNLCENKAHVADFPDRHFDLETVVRAGIRPVAVSPDESFVGFFGPEKFEALKGAMSFDEIWGEISKITSHPRVYIVSWNDHFFVLKAEADAYYIIDTLGERLFEGCDNAYILRFDEKTLMYAKKETNEEKEKVSEGENAGQKSDEAKEESEEIICRGKECCREFMKRFLVAIQLKELESEEKKERVSYYSLHQRLQIEFNYSICLPLPLSLSSSSSRCSSSDSSLTSSLFSNDQSVFISVD